MNPLSPSIRLFLKFWSNSPPWCWPSTVKFTFWKGFTERQLYPKISEKKTGEKKSISPSYPNDELQNMHLLCFWENVVKFWDLVVFNSYNIPRLQVLQHFENKMSVLQTLYLFHSNKVKLLLPRFWQHHLVSRATEAIRSRPRCSVSCHLTNVVKWPNVIANYLENDNVVLPKRREKKVSWEFTLFL